MSPAAQRPSLASIHHVAFTVTEVEASVAWYERILGVQRMGQYEHDSGYGIVLVEPTSQVFIVLHRHRPNEGEPFSETRTGLDHASFRVRDRAELEAWQRWFEEQGVVHSPITPQEGFPVLVLVFRDPDNIQLELFTEQ